MMETPKKQKKLEHVVNAIIKEHEPAELTEKDEKQTQLEYFDHLATSLAKKAKSSTNQKEKFRVLQMKNYSEICRLTCGDWWERAVAGRDTSQAKKLDDAVKTSILNLVGLQYPYEYVKNYIWLRNYLKENHANVSKYPVERLTQMFEAFNDGDSEEAEKLGHVVNAIIKEHKPSVLDEKDEKKAQLEYFDYLATSLAEKAKSSTNGKDKFRRLQMENYREICRLTCGDWWKEAVADNLSVKTRNLFSQK